MRLRALDIVALVAGVGSLALLAYTAAKKRLVREVERYLQEAAP